MRDPDRHSKFVVANRGQADGAAWQEVAMKATAQKAALLITAVTFVSCGGAFARGIRTTADASLLTPPKTFAKPLPAEIRNAMQHASPHAKRDDAQYTIIDDPGEGYALGQGTFSFGLNSLGAVVGYYDDGKTHGFERATDGSYRTIDVGKRGTAAADINDKGAIAGQTNFYSDQGQRCPGFLLTSKGKLKKFEPPDIQGCSEDTFSIGKSSSIVGDYEGSDGRYHGFLRTKDGAIAAIDAPGAVDTFASDINDISAVTGTYIDNNGYHGYIRSAESTFTTFDAPGGPASGTIAGRINNLGEVEGDYANGDGVSHGLIRNPDGSLTEYDAPDAGHGAGQGTYGYGGINNQGTVAGFYWDANNVAHGYVRSSDGVLTEFDPPGSIWTVVWDINDSGVVTGTYMDQFANFHRFLRTP